MGKTLNLMIKNLQSFVDDCYDTIALFLCWHLVMRYQLTCHKRAVPALDKHWETLTIIIWPRYLNLLKYYRKGIIELITLVGRQFII